jgi:hypothetical protein
MSFKLCSQIAIGKYAFSGGVNEVKIHRSVKAIMDTATIKIPAAGRVANPIKLSGMYSGLPGLSSPNNAPESSVETSTLWHEGDKVNILLGYNQDYRQEFMGFVRRVSPSIPLLIECEGYAWQLRRKRFIGTWKTIQLIDFLQILVSGTDIKLSPNIPSVPLINLSIKSGNAVQALEYIRDNMHLACYFQFDVLYVGLEEVQPGKIIEQVKYRLGWNVIRDDKLKYRLASDNNVLVQIYAGKGKNKKRPVFEAGDKSGGIIKEYVSNIADRSHLQRVANEILLYAKYTGFEGGITGFLQPYCNPSDTVVLIDKKYNVRTGSYFVDGIEVIFGMNGAQRIVHITRALSVPNFAVLIGNSIGNSVAEGIASAAPLVR